eukprot:g5314.t1 g5314   contig2:237510-239363(-)
MKLSNSWSSLLLLLAAAASTTSAEYTPPTTNYDRCLTADEAADITTALSNGVEVDLFPEKVSSDQSVYWEIDYRSTYKILKNTQDTVNTTYLLYQCGLPEPTPETHPELEGITFDSVFSVPHTGGLLVTATTQIPNIEILNRRSQVVAFAVSENLVSSPCLSQQIIPAGKEDGSITFLPLYNDTVIEDYVTEHPDTLVLGGAWDTDLKMKNKVIISDVGESPEEALDQNRDVNEAIFEWLEVYGSLFNEEGLAGGVVSDTKGRYNCHTDNAAMIAESRRELRDVEERRLEEGSRPVVLWAYHNQDFEGNDVGWDVGECPNYYCTYAKHCHVEMLNSTEGSIDYWGYPRMTDEEFLEFGKNADVWVYPSSDWNRVSTQKMFYLSQFKAVQDEKVYDYQMSGESAWFEQRLAEYDTVLLDLCHIVDRAVSTDPPHIRKWFRNVYTEGVGTLGMCEDPEEPYTSRATECVRLDDVVGGGDVEGGGDTATEVPAASSGSRLAVVLGAVSILSVVANVAFTL